MIYRNLGRTGVKVSDTANCHQRGVTSPIIGPRNLSQLEDNLGAVDVSLTDEDRRRIDGAAPPGRAISPMCEGDWGPHPHRW